LAPRIIGQVGYCLKKKYQATFDSACWSVIGDGGEVELEASDLAVTVLRCDVHSEDGQLVWMCRLTEEIQEPTKASRTWTSEYGLRMENRSFGRFSCAITYRDDPGSTAQVQDDPVTTTPCVVRRLLEDPGLQCYSDALDQRRRPPIPPLGSSGDIYQRMIQTHPAGSLPPQGSRPPTIASQRAQPNTSADVIQGEETSSQGGHALFCPEDVEALKHRD
jgi:hypothetical protein